MIALQNPEQFLGFILFGKKFAQARIDGLRVIWVSMLGKQ